MSDVTTPARPALVTIPNVELVKTGHWELSSGPFDCTAEDLVAAVAAQDDPAIRTPILKIGHVDQRFDGEPAIGRIDNMRVSADGQTLIGDLVGIPAWLAEVIPSAWPFRSFEGFKDYSTANGTSHRFIVSAVALLGVTAPGIETLADIADRYGVAASQPSGDGLFVSATFEEGPMPEINASVSTEDVRRNYYDGPGSGWEWWICEIQIDPAQLIVENEDTGEMYRVPYSVDGDTVSFEDPVRVVVQYVDQAAAKAPAVVFASRAESRPNDPRRRDPVAGGPAGRKEASTMDAAQLRTRLGLPEDASDEDVEAKLTELEEAAKPPVVEPKVEPAALPEGVVAIDESTLEELKVAATRGNDAHETLRRQERDRFLDDAVKAGKFAPARKEHFAALYDVDETGTKDLVAKLAAGTVPLVEAGHAGSGESGEDIAAEASAFLTQVGLGNHVMKES